MHEPPAFNPTAFDPTAFDPADFAPGTMGCHEALHMAHVLAELVEQRLARHPAVLIQPAWRALADQAVDALQTLYQAIGQRHR